MKRLTAALLMLSLLICGSFALGAAGGGIDDPLISLSYLTDTFLPSVVKKTNAEADTTIGAMYYDAISRVNALMGPDMTNFSFADGFMPQSFGEGGTLSMLDFTGFILLSGSANIQVNKGEVIDLSTGTTISDAAVLEPNRRYFAAENTTATVRVYSPDTNAMTDGYYRASISGTIPRELRFIDIPTSHWANEYIVSLAEQGLVNGIGNSVFAPNNSVTRGMFVTILGRLYGASDTYENSGFDDVDLSQWYGPYVAWAAQNGIVNGYGDGVFGPDDNITREQMAVIIMRYAEFTGIFPQEATQTSAFSDASDISDWALSASDFTQKTGIITGKPGNLFDPRGTAVRSEISAVTYRFIEASK